MPFVSKCTQKLTKAVAGFVESGLPFRDACALAGVTREAAYRWLAAASKEDPNPEYVAFAVAVAVARAKFKQQCLKAIKTGAQGWQSRAWLLERLFPADFSLDRREMRVMLKQLTEMEAMIKELSALLGNSVEFPEARTLPEMAIEADADGMDDEHLDNEFLDTEAES